MDDGDLPWMMPKTTPNITKDGPPKILHQGALKLSNSASFRILKSPIGVYNIRDLKLSNRVRFKALKLFSKVLG